MAHDTPTPDPKAQEAKNHKWTTEQTVAFLNHVGQYPCLWNEQVTSKKHRMLAKKEIAAALNLTTKFVHQKLITLSGQFHRESKRIALDPSKCRLEWYAEADFFNRPSAEPETELTAIHVNMCRVCLESIADPIALAFRDFATQYTDCTGFFVQERINEPAFICSECQDELMICSRFQDKVRQTENTLNQNLLPEEVKNDELEPKEEIHSTSYVKLEIETLEEKNDVSNLPEQTPATKRTRTATKPKRNLCPVCGILVDTRRYELHMGTHKGMPAAQRYVCFDCGRSYRDKAAIVQHLRAHTKETRYQCQFCELKFINWNARRFHIRSKHMVEKPFHCPICEKQFLSKVHMREHIEGDHNNRTLECEQCKKSFSKRNNLRKHIRIVHGDVVWKSCDKCDKKFKTNRYLRQHYVTHTGEKNYLCPVKQCGKAFAQNHVLRSHVEKVHPEVVDQLPPSGTIVSIRGVKRLQEWQSDKDKLLKIDI